METMNRIEKWVFKHLIKKHFHCDWVMDAPIIDKYVLAKVTKPYGLMPWISHLNNPNVIKSLNELGYSKQSHGLAHSFFWGKDEPKFIPPKRV